MKQVISVWNIVAGALWAIISLIFMISMFGSMDSFGSGQEGAAVALVLIIFFVLLAGYILCTIGVFTSKYNLLKIGALMTAIDYSILFFFLFIGIASAMDLYIRYVGGVYVFFVFAGLIVQAMAYFSLWSLARRQLNYGNVDRHWFRPAMYFAICLVITIIAIASMKKNFLGVTLNFGTFNNWLINILWIGALGFTGYAIKNPVATPIGQNGFVQPGGFANQNNMFGQQNGYMNQNMYGQQNGYNQQANPYVDSNAYNQQQNGYINQNMNNQQQNGYMNPNNMFNQQSGYVDPNAYNQPQNGYMNQNMNNQQQNGYMNPNNMYNQQQGGYVDPNGQYNNQQ